MSIEEKLEKLLTALSLVAISSSDDVAARYCAMILEEVGEFERIKKLIEPPPDSN